MKLASVETVLSVQPHPNADRLDLVGILGWQCVVKRGEFAPGDAVVFVPIDTVLPLAPWSEFLAAKNRPESPIRLRTARLRGEHSQGLVLPLSILPPGSPSSVGTEVGKILGIRKYEKEVPAHLAGVSLGPFPSHLAAATDEENGLSNPDLVSEVLDHPVTVTRKLDGSSCTVIIENGEITHVCSRRMLLKETPESSFWLAARRLSPGLPPSGRIVVQGEVMGPGVQGNQLGLSSPELHVFQVQVGRRFLDYDEMSRFCLEKAICQAVPKIAEFPALASLSILQELADSQVLASGAPAEGIVVRPRDYRRAMNGRPLGFKIINRNYGE
jgi:RNA ligase (TIGR02306 family)